MFSTYQGEMTTGQLPSELHAKQTTVRTLVFLHKKHSFSTGFFNKKHSFSSGFFNKKHSFSTGTAAVKKVNLAHTFVLQLLVSSSNANCIYFKQAHLN